MVSFNEKVWALLKKIPRGKVSTYSAIARAMGKPRAARAVGNACNANPNAPMIPCHRVVKSNGRVGEYAFGEKKKIFLLKKEGITIKQGKIIHFKDFLFKLWQ